MLPTLSDLAEDYYTVMWNAVRRMAYVKSPMLAQIGSNVLHESGRSILHRADGTTEEMKIEENSASYSTPLAELRRFSAQHRAKTVDALSSGFAEGAMKMLLRVMDETTSKTGNVVDAGGRPFHEAMFEMLERMPANLEGDLPSLLVGPGLLEKIKGAESDDEQRNEIARGMRRVHEKKWGELRDRKADRVLVG